MRNFYGSCLLVVFWILLSAVSYGQNYPADFAQVVVANTIANPTALAFAPDGRIFVAEQGGKLRVIKNGTLLPTAFVQPTVSATGERGLIGVALDPDFSSNQFVYVYYTVAGSPAHNRISRFTAAGDVAQPNSESIVLELDPLSNATNHNGGAMQFGKDGKLYVAVGENANPSHAQNLDTYHGKILRINKDGSVPEGNPFTTGSEQRKRVWAYGLRNPFTFSVHPQTGRIFVNDVGQGDWEEVNDATLGGRNFGWPTTEGKFNPTTFPALTNPIYAYPQGGGDGNGCAITGGTFFYPASTNYPSTYIGKYFFQDFCNRWINYLDVSATEGVRSPFATSVSGLGVALSVGNDGNLYYLSRSAGSLYKIIYNKTTTPYIIEHPSDQTIAEGEVATFTVRSLGSTPLQYQWQKDGSNIAGATSSVFTVNASPDDEGNYRAQVTNAAGAAMSNAARLSVIEDAAPVANITAPMDSSFYAAGTEIEYSGVGIDPEDGPLAADAFQWQIDFHHDTHKHDEPPIQGVVNGKFFIPDEGETSDNVWYTLILTVSDSKGRSDKDSVRILPRKSAIAVTTDPPGLEVLVDGQPVSTPVEIISVEGMKRSFAVESPQLAGGKEFEFESWSNDGDMAQTVATPADDLALTARFSIIVGTETKDFGKNVVLYPNPVNQNFFSIQFSVMQQQNVSIRLVNVMAQEVLATEQLVGPGEHDLQIDISKAGPGIYYFMMDADGRRIAKKLIVASEN